MDSHAQRHLGGDSVNFFWLMAGIYLGVCTLAIIVLGYFALRDRNKQ